MWRFLKFLFFSCTAGGIQIGSFTLLNEVAHLSYWPSYLIALVLSIVYNFTVNRKFTFKSANNIPIAMLKVLGYYAVFTPISTLLGNYFTARFADVKAIEYIVLGITMVTNMVTEFLFQKFVVFKGSENTSIENSQNLDTEAQP